MERKKVKDMAYWCEKCTYCEYCRYIKTKEYDCCDVKLYKCDITGETLDEFHIEHVISLLHKIGLVDKSRVLKSVKFISSPIHNSC